MGTLFRSAAGGDEFLSASRVPGLWIAAVPHTQLIQVFLITPDAGAYAYNVTRKRSGLYVVEGLR